MSSPSFLLANEGNHNLLQSLLESMNAIIEHQFISKCFGLSIHSTVFIANDLRDSYSGNELGQNCLSPGDYYDANGVEFWRMEN